MRKLYWGHGPPQRWQRYTHDNAGYTSPQRRLMLMGKQGLPVGRKHSWLGGVTEQSTLSLYWRGLAFCDFDESGEIVRIYSCQYNLFD